MATTTLKEAPLWNCGMQPRYWCALSCVIYTVNDTLRKCLTLSVSKWCHRWFKDRRAGKRKMKGKKRQLCDRWEPKCWHQPQLLWLGDKEHLIWTSFSHICWFPVRGAALALHRHPISLLSVGRDVTLTPTGCCLRRWRMSSSRKVSAVRSEATEISTTLKSTWAILYSPNSGIWWVISPATACSLPDL